MRARRGLFCVCTLVLLTLAAAYGQGPNTVNPASTSAGSSTALPTAAHLAADYGRLPLTFEANRGQASDRVRYLSRAAGQLLLLENDGAVLRLAIGSSGSKQTVSAHDDLQIRFDGANPNAEIVPLEEQTGKSNYLIGNDPRKWRTNVENYSRIRYNSLYPGVDLIFYGNPSRLEHDFIVAPGANYRRIALQLNGSREVRLAPDGSVIVALANGSLKFSAPKIYQMRGGEKVDVKGGYKLHRNLLAFKVGAHDASLPLIIDPVLSYSTYLAGTQGEFPAGIALDSAGNAYVTGLTFSSDFPTTNSYQPACDQCVNGPDVFITKLNPTGTALVYSTYLGGSGYDQPYSIAVDGSGHAIVGGRTGSTDFPLHNPTQTTPNVQYQGFVASLSKDGTSLNFSTYLGGSEGALISSVVTDSQENVYVLGSTSSPDFPTKPTTNVIGVPPGYGENDLFVAKFAWSGALEFGTTIGANPQQLPQPFGSLFSPVSGALIAVDASHDVYISGGTGPGFLVTPGAFQTTYTGPDPDCGSCTMGFIAELKPDGSAFVFASYLGGSSGDQVTGLALDASRNIYVTGNTASPDFPVTTGAFQASFPGTQAGMPETFVTKMNSTGSALVYSSFLGGPNSYNQTYASGIAVDSAGEAVVTGLTSSPTFPLVNPLQTALPAGATFNPTATYLTKFNAAGSSVVFSTLFSGSTGSNAAGVALSATNPNDVYITGTSFDTNLPTTPGAFQPSVAAPPPSTEPEHVYVAKFDLGVPASAVCPSQPSLYLAATYGQISYTDVVVLENCGNAPLAVSDVTITGPFTQRNTCQNPVQPGGSCDVGVVFRSHTPGTFTGSLTISHIGQLQPLVISLSGQATAPAVYLPQSPFQLNDQLVGQTGPPQVLPVYNQGTDFLSITSVTVAGSEFSAKPEYCLNVAPGNGCDISVNFHPVAAGLQTATLTLVDNAPDSPQIVTIEANGLAAYPVPAVSYISPTTILQGSAAQVVYVQGGEFFPSSKIIVQGMALATTYNGETSLSATIPASMLKNLAELDLQVSNPAPGGGTSNSSTISVYQDIPIGANALVYEPYTRKLYASISSAATSNPKSILSIDPETQILGTPDLVGANPNHMALSADGSYLYVGLDGASAVQQVQLPSGALGTSTSLASIATGQPVNAFQIAVVPGREKTFVASLQLPYTDPSEAGVGLVLNGKLVSTLPGFGQGEAVDNICFLSQPAIFYGSSSFAPQLYDFTILNNDTSLSAQGDSSGPLGFGFGFVCDSKYLYDFEGDVFDPVANRLVGTYPFGFFANAILPDDSVARTYAAVDIDNANVVAFDQNTFAQVGSIPVPTNSDQITSLLRWGTDGFAYLSYNYSSGNSDLILLRSSVAQPSVGPNPVPAIAHTTPEVPAGHGNYQLTVTGTNFVPGAVVEWNGSIRTTIFQSSTTLIADIPASDVAVAGTAEISVENPPFTGNSSNKHNYTILPAQ